MEWEERTPWASQQLCVYTSAPSLQAEGSSAPVGAGQDAQAHPSSRQATSRLQSRRVQPGL